MPTDARRRQPAIGPAPGKLETVRAFVNTLDIEAGTDDLTSPADLATWLSGRGLIDAPAEATAADLRAAIQMREALRAVMRAHAQRQPTEPAALDGLRRIASGLPTSLTVSDDGRVRADSPGTGPAAGLARILLIAAESSAIGTWPRLKACSADDCQWAFYDRSPTRSGCWCSMAICGSRAKSRAYRRRAARKSPSGA